MDQTTHDLPAVPTASPTPAVPPEVLETVLIGGDLSGLTSQQRADYYGAVCRALGVNPLTKPFEYLTLNGKLRLYALRDCADQLRRLHGISITITSRERWGERRGGAGLTRPDQHGARLVHRHLVHLNEFLLEGLQLLVVQLKLEFEHPIAHSATALEHG